MPRFSTDFRARDASLIAQTPFNRPTKPAAHFHPRKPAADRADSDRDDEPWDDELEEELEPLDDSDLEIDDEPDPDDGDFWIDPDEGEDPWN